MNLDDELRSALRRREPSPDFTARVLARASIAAITPAQRRWFSRPATRWLAAMAATLLLSAGTLEYRHYQGERAKSQVLLAMHIAARKLNRAQRKVQMITHRSNS